MKSNLLISAIFTFFLCHFSYGITERNLLQKETSQQQLKEQLVIDKSWIKYPAYTNRAGWDKFTDEYKNDLIKRGEKSLNYEWKVIKAMDYIEYFRSGNRNIMQIPYNQNISAIVDLFVAELTEGKGRFIEPLMNLSFTACEMTSWSLSAHLTLQKDYKRFPMPDDYAVELASAEVGALMSWIYFYMKDEFDKIEPMMSKRLFDEVHRRIINPYMENDHYWWLGFNLSPQGLLNNWTPWCNTSVLECMLLLEDDPEKLSKNIYRTLLSTDNYLNFITSDGACDEGPSYWRHAAGKLYDYLELLKLATNGKTDIFDIKMIKDMGEYISRSYVGNYWVVNFADAVAKLQPDHDLIYRYGKAVNSNEMMQFAAFINSENIKNKRNNTPNEGRDILRLFETLKYKDELKTVTPKHQSPPYTWYSETQFCYLNGKEMFVAMKGGNNNESHNHNDIGTFSMWIDYEPIFIDAGVGTYTRQTFSEERYNIWTMQSQYHNLPVIDGKPQVVGKTNKATNVKFDPKRSTFSLDIHTAYPDLAKGSKWNRSYTLKGKTLNIKDQFSLINPQTPNAIHFLTRGKITTQPGKVLIEINGKNAHLTYNKNLLDAIIEPFELTDPRLSGVWGDTLYRVKLIAKNLNSKGSYEYQITKL